MEKTVLTELTTLSYPIDELSPFALQYFECDDFCLIGRQSIEILRIDFKFTDDSHIRLVNSSINPPATIVTKSIPTDALRIYNNAELNVKQELCLDSMLLPELAQSPFNVSLIAAELSPIDSSCGPKSTWIYLACLNNHGGCFLQSSRRVDRNWNNLEILDISGQWLQTNRVTIVGDNKIQTYDELKSIVENVHITAIAWNNTIFHNDHLCLACATASGKLIIFDVKSKQEHGPDVNIQNDFELNLLQVNTLVWFTYQMANECWSSIMIAADLYGDVHLYQIQFDADKMNILNVEPKRDLWMDNDKLRITKCHIEYDRIRNELFIVLCKGSFVLVFQLDASSFVVNQTEIHYVKDLFITSLTQISPHNYILSTVNGIIQKLTFISTDDDDGFRIEATEIMVKINLENHHLYGLTISRNQAFWLLATYPRQPFDHLVLRRPVLINVCATDTMTSIYNKLLNNPSLKLTDYYDCVELIRFVTIKNNELPLDDALLPILENEQPMSETFLYKLKIRIIVLSARAALFYRKHRLNDSNAAGIQITMAKKAIAAITFYRQLSHLLLLLNSSLISNFTNFQRLSTRCMLLYLNEYLQFSIADDPDEMNNCFIRNLIQDPIVSLLQEYASILNEESAPELCVHCNEFIDSDKLMCKENHNMPRCCITMVQVPIINSRHCRQCKAVALDDPKDLQQILVNNSENDDDIFCPLCDLPMVPILK